MVRYVFLCTQHRDGWRGYCAVCRQLQAGAKACCRNVGLCLNPSLTNMKNVSLKNSDTSDQATLKTLEQLKKDKEAVEMELQHSNYV